MYSYQHRYHAGNFADLHKHVVLLALLEALQKKDSPFCVLDAFAGEGLYDLNSKESQKNKEFMRGFGVARKALNAPHLVQELLNIAAIHQIEDQTFIYPGSPAIIRAKLRAQDSAVFIENHPQAYKKLRKHFGNDSQIHSHQRDAIEAISALVPFKEKRGLIFIDPSYEVKAEYKIIYEVILHAYSKFSQGVYILWYPLLREGKHVALSTKLHRAFHEIWQHEWITEKSDIEGLYGSGIIVINPPWQLNKAVHDSLNFLRLSYNTPAK